MFKKMAPKFKLFYEEFKNKEFSLLDIGCGNHSASIAKALFKNCRYYGVDRENYNNSDRDFSLMEQFYKVDLEHDSLGVIPDNTFDVIMLSHVIEHLSNGLTVIAKLLPKLKQGGIIYIEYPSVRSLNFPSMKGTLNFCDDPTHIRLYDIKEICNLLLENEFRIHKAGNLRDPLKILQFPALVLYHAMRGSLGAGVFWYVVGFADFVYARKK